MTGRVLTLAQQKGGSGKTTLAVNLAGAAQAAGLSVALVDTDPQGSLGRWFMTRRARMGDEGVEFATGSAWGVSYECGRLRQAHDLVIIDTPPRVDAGLRPALREATLILVPVSASELDFWAVDGVLDLIRREDRPARMVLNRAAPRTRLAARLEAALAEMPLGRTKAALANRVAYAEALGAGMSVVEAAPCGKAACEVGALWVEVAALLGL